MGERAGRLRRVSAMDELDRRLNYGQGGRLRNVGGTSGGLGSFLLGHVAYVIGMAIDHRSWPMTLVGVVLIAAGIGYALPQILRGVKKQAPGMQGPVLAYVAVISSMGVAAFGRTVVIGIAGALLGGFISTELLDWGTVTGWNWRSFAIAVAGSLLLLLVYRLIARRHSTVDPRARSSPLWE